MKSFSKFQHHVYLAAHLGARQTRKSLIRMLATACLIAPVVVPAKADTQPKQAALKPVEGCVRTNCTLSYGSTATIGEGTARAYAFVEDRKSVIEIGILLSSGVLKGLPQDCGKDQPSMGAKWLICQASAANPKAQMNDTMVTTLAMPNNVVELVNIAHLDISWLPMGHAPEKIWDKPQFDMHFPFRAPTGGQDTSLFYAPNVPQTQLPTGYMVLPGSGFHWDTTALQGHSHAADPKTSPEFAGGPFLANFLYIAYNGKAIGYEVYASTKLLDGRGAYSRDLEMPHESVGTQNIPSKLRIAFVPEIDSYRVSLYAYKKLPLTSSHPANVHDNSMK